MASPMSPQAPKLNGTNGTNGVLSPPHSPSTFYQAKGRLPSYASSRAPSNAFSTMNTYNKRSNGAGSHKIGLVQESATAFKKRSMVQLGAGVYHSISDVSYVKFLEWVRAERLTSLPHKGSRWDKVLIRSTYFAEQLHNFDQAIQNFALDSSSAASIGFGHAQLLLELTHDNSEALDKAFSVFYKFAMSFSSVLHRLKLFNATPEIEEQLCMLYSDLISLIVDVAIKFYKAVNGMTSGSVSLEMFELFGDTIETFRTRQSTVVELIWDSQIRQEFGERETIDVKMLSRWLAPQDRVIAALQRDHSTYSDQQVEFTCLWFQKHLSRFFQQPDKNFLLVTGAPGVGKTTLAGSVVERLQRPVNRIQYDTLFCSLSPDIPTTATSLAVVKVLLFQLLNLRIGNIDTYDAILKAYQQCNTTSELQAYEQHLWHAFGEALTHPVAGGNQLVIVVDGLDDIADSKSASIRAGGAFSPETLLEKLVGVTNKVREVRLITLSTSMKIPATATKGVHHHITRDEVLDDLHTVASQALMHNHHFHSQRAVDQERVLDRIIQVSSGSFLTTFMLCEILNAQKSPDAVTKALETVEKQKPTIQDLTLQLFTSLNTTKSAQTLLSWILAAERPLTVDEIHTLFTVDVQRSAFSERTVDINDSIRTLAPLLTLHERIVRFKHPIVHAALHDFAAKNKIPIPLKDSETDLLLRVLTYAKLVLPKQNEPTIEISDASTADRLYRQHHLLEYTVRYWVLHLQQSPLAPQSSGEYKPSPELKKVMPETTLLPILESLVWNTQLPLPQAIDLHKLVVRVRTSVLGTNHPAVLQTFLAIATSYLLLSKPTESAHYFYLSCTISRKILSDIHPLTLDCANHFLQITESLTSTSRTQVMTQREQVLIILITSYERQYGNTSEVVIQTRQLLIQLYVSINEEDKALEIYRLIEEATIAQYGRNSHQAHDLQGHLHVTLGKGTRGEDIDSYKEHFFHGGDEEESVEIFDISSIISYLRLANSHVERHELTIAEKTYVELWMEVSTRCRSMQSLEWHEKNIEIATAYSIFLKSQKRTSESSAILTCVWQQYEHSQLSFTESVVSRLTVVAKEMRSLGLHTQALSIFKYASSYFKNVRQEESSMSREVNQQLSETSTELVEQCLNASTSVTETTTTISESIFQEVFFSIIHSAKTVESSTIALAKTLVAQYMLKKDYAAAVNVITATLQRTWSTFLASSIHDVVMTSTFTQESVELVERLAECYLQTRQLEKVEDTYTRLFRAVLVTDKIEKATFERAKSLLIDFYDKRGYVDKAISIFQELLVTYRGKFGPSNDLTIQMLYILARRCHAHPRNHPYWIDYYLQIITSLNKDSDICHPHALDAIIVVTTTYFEDRRFAEAVSIYRILWKTFVAKTKDHKIFSDVKFVQTLYERYYLCLEETKASWSELYQITKEYRQTVTAVFGVASSIAVEATLSLAQVTQRSEEHASEAIALYEDVSTRSKTITTRTSVSDIHQALSSLYIKQLQSSSSSSLKTETIQRALQMSETRFIESTRQYGYSHESSLNQLRELSILYSRQQKTEVAIKKLSTVVSEIIRTETSSQKQIEAAASLAYIFRSIEQISTAQSLVQELHRQICAKDTRYASKWSFDLTKSNRTALAFLAALQYNIRVDLSVTFAEIMADLTMEYIYFEQFHRTLINNESLTNILLAAAPLRWFLRRNSQQEMIKVVEDQAVDLFVKRDAQDLNTLSKESPRIFIIGILDHLGNGRNKNFNRSVILASNNSVTKLTKVKKFPEAYDIANLGYLYASKNDGYNGPRAISMGFKLASLLVGREGEKCEDAVLRKKMHELSNRIVKRILEICKSLKINFAQVHLFELSQLSVLLGEQEDYVTLEWLLTTLWNTRDAQRKWPAEVLLNLGRRLICARYLAHESVQAIRLAEDIAYNMRRAHGPRAPVTIETYELLAQLYTSTGLTYGKDPKTAGMAQDNYKKAVGVHEDILRLMVSGTDVGDDGDSDDELDTTAALLAREGVKPKSPNGETSQALDAAQIDKSAIALKHLHLLKLAYQRLGSWPRPYEEYARLNAQLFRTFGSEPKWKGVEGTEKWDAKAFGNGKAESEDGTFGGTREWSFGSDKLIMDAEKHQHGGDGGLSITKRGEQSNAAYA